MIRYLASLILSLALVCSQASAGFLINSFAVKGPIQFVGATTSLTTTLSTSGLTGGIDSSIQAGDLVMVITTVCNTSNLDMTVSGGGYTWTEDQDSYANASNADTNSSVHWTIAGAAPSGDLTTTSSGAGSLGQIAALIAFRNANATQFDAATVAVNQTTTTTADPGSITTVTANAVVVAVGTSCIKASTAANHSNPTGYTSLATAHGDASTNSSSLQISMLATTTAGANNPASMGGSGGSNSSSISYTLAIRP